MSIERTKIITEPEDNVVVAGSMVTFYCKAIADHSLNIKIVWLANNEPINYYTQPRFVKNNDNSMTITKTIELDSGIYTCLAKTELDQVSMNSTLIVQVKYHYLCLMDKLIMIYEVNSYIFIHILFYTTFIRTNQIHQQYWKLFVIIETQL